MTSMRELVEVCENPQLAHDRPDILFAAKETARWRSQLDSMAWEMGQRCGRFSVVGQAENGAEVRDAGTGGRDHGRSIQIMRSAGEREGPQQALRLITVRMLSRQRRRHRQALLCQAERRSLYATVRGVAGQCWA